MFQLVKFGLLCCTNTMLIHYTHDYILDCILGCNLGKDKAH